MGGLVERKRNSQKRWLYQYGTFCITKVYLDDNGDLVGVFTSFELMQYFEKKSKVVLKAYQSLEEQNVGFEDCIRKEDLVSGRSIVGCFLAVKKAHRRVSLLFVFDETHWLNSQGFRELYGRYSHGSMLRGNIMEGGELLKEESLKRDGKSYPLWYMRMPLKSIEERKDYLPFLVEKAKL